MYFEVNLPAIHTLLSLHMIARGFPSRARTYLQRSHSPSLYTLVMWRLKPTCQPPKSYAMVLLAVCYFLLVISPSRVSISSMVGMVPSTFSG